MFARKDIDFSVLNKRYRQPLLAFFRRRSVNHADAEDMVQELFVRLMGPSAQNIENADAYIFQTAANLLRDKARRERVRQSGLGHLSASETLGIEVLDPSRILLGREALIEISHLLLQLPERTRNIFLLYRMEGIPQQDIGKKYNISVRAVQKHIFKAFEYILANLQTEWEV